MFEVDIMYNIITAINFHDLVWNSLSVCGVCACVVVAVVAAAARTVIVVLEGGGDTRFLQNL